MFTPLRRLVALCLLAVAALPAAVLPAIAFETRATAAWVYDMSTHTVLMDKNADTPVPPASMSKLMTLNMLFEALRDNRVTMDTTFSVSSRATEMTRLGGSTMYLQENDRPAVKDLIHGIIINSGNDACVVVAEGLAGTESAFADLMTERGKAIGLTQSTFTNASGWPDPNQRMSMHDLGTLGKRIIEEFPEFYPIFSQTQFNYKDRAPANANNRNPLLKIAAADWKADGLKTGHTTEAGYGLVGSAVMGDRRVIFAMTGLPSDKDRASEAEAIVNWAFRQFTERTVVKAGVRIAEAPVWLGGESTVGLVPAEDIRLLLPSQVQESVTAEVIYNGPVEAPVAKGTQIAELIIHVPDLPDARLPLVAESDVPKGGFLTRLSTAANVLFTRYVGSSGTAPAS